jgi:hypothetical protein
MLFTTHCDTLLTDNTKMAYTRPDTCTNTEVTSARLRISSFKKIKFKYENGDKEIEDNLTTSSLSSGNGVVVGIKRKLSSSSFSSSPNASDEGLDDESSGGPLPSYSPTLRKLSCQLPTTETGLSTGMMKKPHPPLPPLLPLNQHLRKLRIVHDRYNPFLNDRLFETILSYFSLSKLLLLALVSKRWNLFAKNRLNQLMFSSTLDNGEDLQAAVIGLEKMKDEVNQRLRRLSQIRRHRLTARFLLWRDNGQDKQAMPSPPPWAFWLHTYGFPLSEFRTYTVDEVFHWIMNNYLMDDNSKEEWSSLIMESNVVAFVFRPCGR